MSRELEIFASQLRTNLDRNDVDLMTPSEILAEVADCIDDALKIARIHDERSEMKENAE